MPDISPRPAALAAVALAALAALAACADAPTAAPAAAPRVSPAVVAYVGDTAVATFTYQPATGNTEWFGSDVKLTMPAYSVCDPTTSGYGPSTWNKSCTAAASPIAFTVKAWRKADGHVRLTVSPDVRFVPTKTVMIYVKDAVYAAAAQGYIGYCRTGSTTCVNEGALDASQVTKYDAVNGFVYRRLKHFSGYNVMAD